MGLGETILLWELGHILERIYRFQLNNEGNSETIGINYEIV